jgi:hypothetical protein
MTKSKGIGRGVGSGGKRPGAGRKPSMAVAYVAPWRRCTAVAIRLDAADDVDRVRLALAQMSAGGDDLAWMAELLAKRLGS